MLFCIWHYLQAEKTKSGCPVGVRQRLASLGQQGTADENQEAESKSLLPTTALAEGQPQAGVLFFLLIT